jgi:hypothetical protein
MRCNCLKFIVQRLKAHRVAQKSEFVCTRNDTIYETYMKEHESSQTFGTPFGTPSALERLAPLERANALWNG